MIPRIAATTAQKLSTITPVTSSFIRALKDPHSAKSHERVLTNPTIAEDLRNPSCLIIEGTNFNQVTFIFETHSQEGLNTFRKTASFIEQLKEKSMRHESLSKNERFFLKADIKNLTAISGSAQISFPRTDFLNALQENAVIRDRSIENERVYFPDR